MMSGISGPIPKLKTSPLLIVTAGAISRDLLRHLGFLVLEVALPWDFGVVEKPLGARVAIGVGATVHEHDMLCWTVFGERRWQKTGHGQCGAE